MRWIYPGQAVCRADGTSSQGTITAMAEAPNGQKSALVAWITGGETWELMRGLMLMQQPEGEGASQP